MATPVVPKLTLVLVLMGLMGAMHVTMARLRRTPPGPDAQALSGRLALIGAASTLTSLAIVALAVLSFH